MKKSKIVGTIVAAIIIVAGVFGLVYNAVVVYNGDLKYFMYKNVEATISSVQSSYVDGKSYYKATYSFIVDGASYSCNSGFTEDASKYIVGETATVRYDDKNPSNCYALTVNNTFNYLYLGISCIVVIIGLKLFDRQTRSN